MPNVLAVIFLYYRGECPYANEPGVNFMHIGCTFTQDRNEVIIPKSWLLLDMCSTVSVYTNEDIVIDIRDISSNEYVTAVTNGGSQVYKKIVHLIILPIKVHFNQDSMGNILSFL